MTGGWVAWSAVAVSVFFTAACGSGGEAPDNVGGPATTGPPATTGEPMTAGGPAAAGERLASQRGCVACHSTDGSTKVGPTWKGLAGSTVRLADGTTVTADAEYLARSIREPQAQIVEGFRGVPMPELGLDEAQIADLVAYIQSLR